MTRTQTIIQSPGTRYTVAVEACPDYVYAEFRSPADPGPATQHGWGMDAGTARELAAALLAAADAVEAE